MLGRRQSANQLYNKQKLPNYVKDFLLPQHITPGSTSLKDFMAFVAPLPQPLPKFLAVIQPLHYYVWAALVFSVVVTAVVLNLVARGEARTMGFSYKKWDALWETTWYCFGTMLAKGPSEETSLHKHALRHGTEFKA